MKETNPPKTGSRITIQIGVGSNATPRMTASQHTISARGKTTREFKLMSHDYELECLIRNLD